MRGIIKTIQKDIQYEFCGTILGDDNIRYFFNKKNWSDPQITIDQISTEDEVLFDLKRPNKTGHVFPKLIRFKDDTNDSLAKKTDYVFKTAHSRGNFNDFVHIKLSSIQHLLQLYSSDYSADEVGTSSSLYKRLATFYNELSDDDFDVNDDGSTLKFPSGFKCEDHTSIYLYCVPNRNGSKSWYCDRIWCSGKVLGGSIFDQVNANWYDIQGDLSKLIDEDSSEDISLMVERIDRRCWESSLVYLKDGIVSTESDADELFIPTGYMTENKIEIHLRCIKQKGIKGYGWYYNCAVYASAPLEVYNKKDWYGMWARYAENNEFLNSLVNQTLEEAWSFGSRNDNGILKNYLRYTFARQWNTGNIAYSNDGQYAVFNTGLPDRNSYKYLYAFFERVEASEKETHPLFYPPKYEFKEFVVSGRGIGKYGKILSTHIRPLPNPPQYFNARSATVWELDYNDGSQITEPEYDDIHILIQRCERLPLEFYRYPATRSPKLQEILESNSSDYEKYKNIREYFKPILTNEPDAEVTEVYNILGDTLKNVITNAVKKLSWNWRAVVPCFNPEKNETCFLLPVSFCDRSKPDRAMIASYHEIDNEMTYVIHTVIPLDWAYLDARLVCRPESEWLAADCISSNE